MSQKLSAEVVLLDLDETVMVEHESVDRAFLTVCQTLSDGDEAASALMHSLRAHARALWHAGPAYGYCERVGVSSWEGLTGSFPGEHPDLVALRGWLSEYRREAWTAALKESKTRNAPDEVELTARLRFQRARQHICYPESREVLADLAQYYRLAIVTNGSEDVQNEKIDRAAIRNHFETITISGELHTGKPDPKVFEHALAGMSVSADRAVMVGDSLRSDIEGAHAAGISAVWLDRSRRSDPGTAAPEATITSLVELSDLLEPAGKRT